MSLKQESKLIQAHIKEVQTGKSSAYEQLYHVHSGRIYTFGLKYFDHNKPAAEELTKRVFFNAYVQINSYPQNIPFILWLIKLAVEEIRNGDIKISDARYQSSPADESVFSLPGEDRLVFILSDIEKLSTEEIAKGTDYSPEQINAILIHARKLMMEKLEINSKHDPVYRNNFISQKSEPCDDLWNIIYNEIHSFATEDFNKNTAGEVLNVGEAKTSVIEKQRKLKKRKRKKVYLNPSGLSITKRAVYTFLLLLLIAAVMWYLFFLKPPQWEVISLSGSPSLKGNLRNIIIEDRTTFERNDILITDINSKAVLNIPGFGEILLNPGSNVKRESSKADLTINSGVIDIIKPAGSEPLQVKVNAGIIEDYKPGAYSIMVKGNEASVYSMSASLKIFSNERKVYLIPQNICEIKNNKVGIPYSTFASEELISAVNAFSFDGNNDRLNMILVLSEKKDALTLLNMIHFVDEDFRNKVIRKLHSLIKAPIDINPRRASNLNEGDFEKWLEEIEKQNQEEQI